MIKRRITEEYNEEEPAIWEGEDLDDEYEDSPEDDLDDEYDDSPEYDLGDEYDESSEDDLDDEYEESEYDEDFVEDDEFGDYSEVEEFEEIADDEEYDEFEEYDESDNSLEDSEVEMTFEDFDEDMFDNEEPKRPSYAGIKWAIALTVATVLIVIATLGSLIYFSSKNSHDKNDNSTTYEELVGVGSSIAGIDFIGQKGIEEALQKKQEEVKALVDALDEKAKEEAEDKQPYVENDLETKVTMELKASSVLKDLKVKLVNSTSGKLLANVPFNLTVTYPDGSTKNWNDDDKDGIIYYSDLKAGKYKIHFSEITEEKYLSYGIPKDAEITVKEKIEYAAVDVKDEILDPSKVNEQKEDTVRGGAGEGDGNNSLSKDTVAFVESAVSKSYVEVDKNSITIPFTIADLGAKVIYPYRVSDVVEKRDETEQNSPESNQQAEGDKDAAGSYTAGKEPDAGASTDKDSSNNTDGSGVNTEKTPEIKLEKTSTTLYSEKSELVSVSLVNAEFSALKISSSDEAVAKAEITSDNKLNIIVGNEGGSATILLFVGEEECKAEIFVTVIGKKDKLKAGDVQLYVCDNGTYREAVYEDYFVFTAFYKEIKSYSGWQEIDGRRYYYTAEGKAVTGEQIIQGVMYNFDSSGALVVDGGVLGIDVSKWNGKIDWNKVKSAGVSYVIIRVGYRGSSLGGLIDDATFKSNIQGASAAGLKVGVYWVTQAINDVEAVEEASAVLTRIAGYKITYPVFLDVEPSGGRGDNIDKATRTSVCKTFCQTIQNAGYTAGIYANKTWFTTKMDASQLSGYKIWLAQYNDKVTYTGSYNMWQYTDKGSIDGIKGKVDLNMSYLGY